MTIHRLSKIVIYTMLVSMLTGCASLDRVAITKFEPTKTEENAQFFKFTAFADAVYPLNSAEAEKTRIEWLETWLQDNNQGGKKYEIISRVPVLRKKGLLGEIYDIFYDVKVLN